MVAEMDFANNGQGVRPMEVGWKGIPPTRTDQDGTCSSAQTLTSETSPRTSPSCSTRTIGARGTGMLSLARAGHRLSVSRHQQLMLQGFAIISSRTFLPSKDEEGQTRERRYCPTTSRVHDPGHLQHEQEEHKAPSIRSKPCPGTSLIALGMIMPLCLYYL